MTRFRSLAAKVSAILTLVLVLTAGSVVHAQPADLPKADVPADRFAVFGPLLGRTWRGVGTGPEGVVDIQRWERAVGGHAVRVVHSVNDGAYSGETLIVHDKTRDALVFHYFTTGGFHTTGVITPNGAGAYEVEETVHGFPGLDTISSTAALGADGVMKVRSRTQKDGTWVEGGGFDYREAPDAVLKLPDAG